MILTKQGSPKVTLLQTMDLNNLISTITINKNTPGHKNYSDAPTPESVLVLFWWYWIFIGKATNV